MEGLAPEGAGEGHIRRIAGVAHGLRGTVHPRYWLPNDVVGTQPMPSLSVMNVALTSPDKEGYRRTEAIGKRCVITFSGA
jgi:hypothetical protein